jgi:oligopeptide transport system substrate-binding protein
MRKYARFIGLGMVAALLLTLIIGSAGAQEKILNIGTLGPTDVPTLDPSLAEDTASIQIILEIFPGLSRLNEVSLATEPGVATWDISDDGLTYTFHIMHDISWVRYNADSGQVEQVTDDAGNVRYLTANDFVYGIRRTLDPAVAGPYSYVLAPVIANGQEASDGTVPVDQIGAVALDDYTLQITATAPAAYNANIFGMWMATAEPQWAVEANGDSWYEPETIESYGPFALKDWQHDQSISIIKNPFWAGTDSIPASKVDEVNFPFLDDSAAFTNFEAGSLDTSPAPLSELDRIKSDPTLSEELYIGLSNCTYFYGFNVTKEPTDDIRVRHALAEAIDRQSLIDNVTKGGQQPAYFLTNPANTAAPLQGDYPQDVVSENVQQAQADLQSYLDDKGITIDQMPTITLMHNVSEGHARIAQAIQQMWKDNLGLDVQIQTQEWAVYLDTIKDPASAPQIYRLGWCNDYPDANNWLGDAVDSQIRQSGWDNAEFDALVAQAKTESDTAVRTDLYAQAEDIISNTDMALIPIYYYTSVQMTQPNIMRTYSKSGNQYFEKWDISSGS